MKILVNYADKRYKQTQNVNSWTGKWIAKFDKVYSFGPHDIDEVFYNTNKHILEISRGNGLWLWKPYFIKRVMDNANEGDVIFYCDSGSFFIKKFDRILESFCDDESIWVSDIPLLEVAFTKPECIKLMDCDNEEVKLSNQIQATFFMARKNCESVDFVNEWLYLCTDFELISPAGNLKVNGETHYEFVVHREDQSILSLLCKKRGVKPHLDPTQRGEHQESYRSNYYDFVPTKHSEDHYRSVIYIHKQRMITPFYFIKKVMKDIYYRYMWNIINK